jgi:glycosyltransferase involved in cell wall biosynthesis
MPSFYKTVDSIVMASSEEGAGLPMMEAAAAGKLCIGTPVGYFEHNGPKGGGIVVPVEETQFIEKTANVLNFYKSDPAEYHKKCLDIQSYAREHYDWSKFIEPWVNFLI